MQKIKVLVVEDEVLVAKDIKSTLQKLGYSVTSIAYSANEALKKAEKESPDLILMDIVLRKGMSSLDAAHKIRSRFDIPIIYVTARSEKKILNAAKETEPYGFLLKPIESKTLGVTIELALHKHKIEKELKEQKQRLTEFMNTDTDAICFIDSNLNILDINKSGLESWDLKRKDIVGKNLLNYVERGQKKRWQNLLQEVLKTGKHFSLFNIQVPYQFGEGVVNIKVFKAGDGLGLIVTDITGQRKAEDAWRQSEERYRQLIENINEGILMEDKDGVITYVNDPFLKMLGYREDEVLGHKSKEFLDEGSSTKKKTKQSKRPKDEWEPYEIAWKRKDGKQLFTLLSPKPLYNEKGRFRGSVSVLTDIMERKKAEKELKTSRELMRNLSQYLQSVRERESKRIAREIHDVMGQQLTALKMDVSWLSHRIPTNKEEEKLFLNKAKAMSDLIDDTIKAVQKISAELRPGLLDDLGLLPAIEWLSQDFQSRTSIQCRMQFDCNELDLDPDCATAIFRISQEALTNIARHAKATHVNIRISERDGRLQLKIRDNGKGIRDDDVLSPTSLGLMGMRERLRPFGGELLINGIPKRGTTLTADIPLKSGGHK